MIIPCTIIPSNPILAIASSEIISYIVPFINNSPLYAINNMILFLFYYFNYYENSLEIINQFKMKYIINYKIEALSILSYLLIYFYNLR